METAEMAASQVTTGDAFTEEADKYIFIPAYAKFAQANLASIE
jgi:hypothetical protein